MCIRRAKYVRKQQDSVNKHDSIKVAPCLTGMLPRALTDASLLIGQLHEAAFSGIT